MPSSAVMKLEMDTPTPDNICNPRTTTGEKGLTPSDINWRMSAPKPPRPRRDHDGMKLTRLLQTLGFILCGAGLFAAAPWSYIIWFASVVILLWAQWLSA